MKMERYVYRAWLLDQDGIAVQGCEEELLASNLGHAVRKAWGKAASAMLPIRQWIEPNNGATIRMEYVKLGSIPVQPEVTQ